jgi:hypothetical protein
MTGALHHRNGLRRGNWSVQELERLRFLLPRRGVEVTATLLRRSPGSVQRKAQTLLRVPQRRGDWTDSDDGLLRDSWGALDIRLLALMSGRSVVDLRRRATELRARRRSGPWSHAEKQRLKDLYGTRADADLEVCFSRAIADIATMAGELCLAKDKRFAAHRAGARSDVRPGDGRKGGAGKGDVELPSGCSGRMPRWTEEETLRLRQLYADRENIDVARALGRTVTSVANKANQLGLRKSTRLLADIGRTNVAVRHGSADAAGDSAF